MVNGHWIMVTGLHSMDIWTTLVDVGAAKLVLSSLPGTVPFPFCPQVSGLIFHGP